MSATPTAPGRVPPHSVEAEEQLLSAILLDGGDVLARADDSGIEAKSFYVPANRVIYQRLYAMQVAGLPIDLAVLAEELKKTKQLDEIGGYPYLTRISGRVPTTAGAAYFIEKVRELAELRETITACTAAVERCYGYTGREDFEKILSPLRDVSSKPSTTIGTLLRTRHFDIRSTPPKPKLRVWLGKSQICTSGNLSALIAQAKAGKSTVVGAILAAFMASALGQEYAEARQDACLGFLASNPEGFAVIHVDTEQSEHDWNAMIRRALARANMTEPPSWLRSYYLAGCQPGTVREVVKHMVRRARDHFGGIACIIIDGVADLVLDVNSPEECNPLIAELHGMAIEQDAPILNIIHENPQGPRQRDKSKARGHLGSQLERKCESNVWIQKTEDGVSVLWSDKMRGAPIPLSAGPAFAWSDVKQRHELVQNPFAEAADEKRAAKLREVREVIAQAWPVNAGSMPHGDLIKAIMAAIRCSQSKAKTLCRLAVEFDLVKKRDGSDREAPYVRL